MIPRIRQYSSSDLIHCRSLWEELTQHHREIYNDPFIGGKEPGLYFDKHLERVGPELIWLAEIQGEVVGLVGLMMDEQDKEGHSAFVEPIVVGRLFQRKGIGRALLNHAITEAKKRGIIYLSIKPVARNIAAIDLYYDAGFRLLGEIEMFMDLQSPESQNWKSGIELFGHSFKY